MAAARRAAISGANPSAALAELAVAAELANAGRTTDVSPAPRTIADRPPTQVDEQKPVTDSVTEPAASGVRPVTREDVIDVETVRIERGAEFETSGNYRTLAGDSILLGYLARDRRGRWVARTATTSLTVPGGPWRTRHDALVGLLLNGGIRTTEARR